MLNIEVNLSNNLIRKGDYFHLSIEIFNDHNNPIVIKEIRINTPAGFIPLGIGEEKPLISPSLVAAITSFYAESIFGSFFSIGNSIYKNLKKYSSEKKGEAEKVDKLQKGQEISNKISIELPIQAKSRYAEEFRIKAGWGGGLRPKPESYIIFGKIKYELGLKIFYQDFKVNISIFASQGSMLSGTLFGSILGTVARGLSDESNMNIFLHYEKLAGTLFLNLILAFIAGLILMRKKDVQPFLTIEDFWGGTLIGFLVGYFGLQFFLQIISGKGTISEGSINNSTNSTTL